MRPPLWAAGVLLTACATAVPSGVTLYSLTPEAITRTGAHDLYQAVEELRPRWLQPCVTVFRNESEYGNRDALREFGLRDVAGVHYIPRGHPRPGAGSAALAASCPAIQVITAE